MTRTQTKIVFLTAACSLLAFWFLLCTGCVDAGSSDRRPVTGAPKPFEARVSDLQPVNPLECETGLRVCPINEVCEEPECLVDGSDQDCDGVEDDYPAPGDAVDNCRYVCNPDQTNSDGDDFGDVCDPCPLDSGNDQDGDRICGNTDNCPAHANVDQLDTDADGIGDACDGYPGGDAAAEIAALQADVALLTAALVELRSKYPSHYHDQLGLAGDPVGSSGELSYTLPGE